MTQWLNIQPVVLFALMLKYFYEDSKFKPPHSLVDSVCMFVQAHGLRGKKIISLSTDIADSAQTEYFTAFRLDHPGHHGHFNRPDHLTTWTT